MTAAPAEVVDQVLTSPWTFLEAAAKAEPGWAEPYGGPEGVTQLASILQAELARQAKMTGELRSAAIGFLRSNHRRTLAEIGESLGITPQGVRKLEMKGDVGEGRFERLRSPEGWA